MKKILIVEDSVVSAKAIELALGGGQFQCTHVLNGQEAIEICQQQGFDLLIVDHNMPVMKGVEAVAQIRKIPDYRGVPICVVSAESSPELMDQARVLGVDLWIIKPLHTMTFKKTVAKLLDGDSSPLPGKTGAGGDSESSKLDRFRSQVLTSVAAALNPMVSNVTFVDDRGSDSRGGLTFRIDLIHRDDAGKTVTLVFSCSEEFLRRAGTEKFQIKEITAAETSVLEDIGREISNQVLGTFKNRMRLDDYYLQMASIIDDSQVQPVGAKQQAEVTAQPGVSNSFLFFSMS